MISEFTDTPVRQRYGRPPTLIPQEIQQWADATYEQDVSCEVPADDEKDSAEFAKLLRLYATRSGKSLSVEYVQTGTGRCLRFRMREKRTYTKKETTT